MPSKKNKPKSERTGGKFHESRRSQHKADQEDAALLAEVRSTTVKTTKKDTTTKKKPVTFTPTAMPRMGGGARGCGGGAQRTTPSYLEQGAGPGFNAKATEAMAKKAKKAKKATTVTTATGA
jgi:hypothetical protein